MARRKWIDLKPYPGVRKGSNAGELTAWAKSPPFAVNPRGILVHRVQYVTMFAMTWGTHQNAHYLCGNSCNFKGSQIDDVLVCDPPKDRLLCTFCEAKAARMKLPDGDKLAGRHVHRGVLVAQQTCCKANK